jgi:hypothetical protein
MHTMSELNEATARQAARSKTAFNWPVMGLAAAVAAYIVWVWVNNYRINHEPPSPPTVSTTK